MSKFNKDFIGRGGNYPVHDYYRDSRDAFGGRYHHPKPARNRSGWVLVALIIAVIAFMAKRFILGQ